jgi:hypothetical protein
MHHKLVLRSTFNDFSLFSGFEKLKHGGLETAAGHQFCSRAHWGRGLEKIWGLPVVPVAITRRRWQIEGQDHES